MVKLGIYTFDKSGHKSRSDYKDIMLFKMTVIKAEKYPPTINKNGNLVLPYYDDDET
jgi:hypothetical protein